MDAFEADGARYDVEAARPDPHGFWVVAWDGALCRGLSVEACVRAIAAAQDAARARFPGRGGVVRVTALRPGPARTHARPAPVRADTR